MDQKQRRSGVRLIKTVISAAFSLGFILSSIATINAFAAANIFQIQNAELAEISDSSEGEIESFDEQTIVSSVTFHKLGDTAKYVITLKNTDNVDHIIKSIENDNENEFVTYEHDSHTGSIVAAGSTFDFIVVAKYANPLVDLTARAQTTDVKFTITYSDIEKTESISINPNTADNIKTSVIALAISATGLIICAAAHIKNHKKSAKYLGAVIILAAAATIVSGVKAATIDVNSFTLTANYSLADKVAVNVDGEDVIIDYGETIENTIPTPSKTGYIFEGWTDEDGNDIDPTDPIYEDIEILPKYTAISYQIRFNANGGEGQMADQRFAYDEAQDLTENAFSYAGHTYMGWDTQANGAGVHYDDQENVSNLTTTNNDIINLYAQWSVNPYFINYDANSGEGEMAATNCEYDQDCTLRTNAFTKTGYNFAGWKLDEQDFADGQTVRNLAQQGTITLIAQWAPRHYTIEFDGNNATDGSMNSIQATYDQDVNLPASAFTRTGYTQNGWLNGNETIANQATVKNLTAEDNATVTLEANWEANHYTISFNKNHDDAQGSINPIDATYDTDVTLPSEGFTRDHYKFMGWATSADGELAYTGGATVRNLTDEANGEITFYAIWKERTSTLETGSNVNASLKTINSAATSFAHYAGTPNLDEIEDEVDIALATSNFPVWAWTEGDTIYWWSEAEVPNYNATSSNMFSKMTTLENIDLKGLNSSTATNMANFFNECKALKSIDLTDFDSSNVKNMSNMFRYTESLPSIDFAKINTSSATDMSGMFSYNGTPTLDISSFDTSNVKTMRSMFEKATSSTIIVGDINTHKVTDMQAMFQDTQNITSLDLRGLDTENVTTMGSMFCAFWTTSKLVNLDISTFDTSKVQNFSLMFYGDIALSNLDLRHFNTSSATTMYYMFNAVRSAATINVSGWTNDNVTDMSYMFYGAGNSNSKIIMDDFATPKVTNMTAMFGDMRSIPELDVSSFNTSTVTKMTNMFNSSYASTPMALQTIYAGDNFTTSALGDAQTVYTHTRAIVGGAGTTWNNSAENYNMSTYSRIDDPDNGKPGYFTYKNARYIRYHDNDGDDSNDTDNYALMPSHYFSTDNTNPYNLAMQLAKNNFTRHGFTFKGWATSADGEVVYNDEAAIANLEASKTPLELYAKWEEITATLNTGSNVDYILRTIVGEATSFEQYTAGTPDFSTIEGERNIAANGSVKVYAWNDAEAGKIYWWSEAYQPRFNTNSASMFASLPTLTSIDLTNLNASTATNLSSLYKGDTALVSTNITAQDTSNATNMNSMFMNTGFTELSLEGLETGNVTDMGNMFNGAKQLSSLDLTPLDTTKVTNMAAMFKGTTNLASIDLSPLNTANVTSMSSLLESSSVSSVNLASLDTTSLTNMSAMFKSTANLPTVDLSPLDVQSVTTMASLFESSGITSINLTPLATESVTDMSAMFKNTLGLNTLDVSPLNTKNVTTMKEMFYGSYHLESLDVSMLDTANVTNMSGTFGILGRQTVLKMYDIDETTKFTTSAVTDMSFMFRGDRALNQGLVNHDLSHIDTSNVTNMSGMFMASRASTLDFSHFDTRKVTSMSQMFFIAPYLSRVDLSYFETPSLTNTSQMFYADGGTGTTYLDFRNADFSKTNLQNFAPYGPYSGKTIHFGKFDLSSTTKNSTISLGNGNMKIYVSTEYDPSIAVERNIVAGNAANGMNGTVANSTTRTYAEYQRIDDPAHGHPGFFWIENPIVVNFDAQGSQASYTKYNYIPGTDYGTLPTATQIPTGMRFDGWYTEAEGGVKVEDNSAFISTDTHTLYAHWVPTVATVTFHANFDGVDDTMAQQVVTGGTQTNLNANQYSVDHYRFLGWTTEPQAVVTGHESTATDYANLADITNLAEDTDLYAKWLFRCRTFATDSWSDIVTNLAGDSTYYDATDICEKEIEMPDDNGDMQSYTLRLVNTSTPEECAIEGFSQTGCGTVIEFADMATLRRWNPTGTTAGGWKASELNGWLNSTFYDRMPEDLKSVIIPTYPIVSGNGQGLDSPDITAEDTNLNKIFLTTRKELNGDTSIDNAANRMRTWDFYTISSHSTYRSNRQGGGQWPQAVWDRSARNDRNNIVTGGLMGTENRVSTYPVFRIGINN